MQKFDLQRKSYGSIPTKKSHETSINSRKNYDFIPRQSTFFTKNDDRIQIWYYTLNYGTLINNGKIMVL